jgi:O-antigen ligase
VSPARIRLSLLGLLILATLPFGSTTDAWRWLLVTVLGFLFCLFLWSGAPIRLGRRNRVALALGGAYLVWLGFQITPLPGPVLARIAPETHRLYGIAVPGSSAVPPGQPAATRAAGYSFPAPEALAGSLDGAAAVTWVTPGFSSFRPISLYPWGTWRNLLQTAALLGFAVMVLSLFRDRRHQGWLAGVLVGLASAQALYGALELLTGHQHILGYEKRFYTDSATGTLVNRNHFAAMLNLALPFMVVMLLERPARRRERLHFAPAWLRVKHAVDAMRQPLFVSLALVTGIGVVLSRSRMGLAAMMAGLLGLSLLLAWTGRSTQGNMRARWIWAAPLLLLGIGVYSLATDALPTMERFRLVGGDLQGTAMRPALWSETLPVVRAHLWTGAGSGAYPHAMNAALSALPLGDFWDYDHAHNDYLEALATLGLTGTLLAAAALCVFLIRRPASLLGVAAMAGVGALVVHSFVDFPLVVPSNALLACAVACLIALPGPAGSPGGSSREGSPRSETGHAPGRPGRARSVAAVAVLAAVCAWPARSAVAAALAGVDYGNAAPPGDERSLRAASALNPADDRLIRRLGQALHQGAHQPPSDVIELGGAVDEQARRLRLEKLQVLIAAHRALLRCLDLAPVDYSLHAELAQTAAGIRNLARESGIGGPAGERGLTSPHMASAALAPTATDNHLALAALLWKERAWLGEAASSIALDLLTAVHGRNRMRHEWETWFVGTTEDGPSLALLDSAVRPAPEAYATLAGAPDDGSNASLVACARTLKAGAALRAAREALGPGPATQGADLQARRSRARGLLESVIQGAGDPGTCGDSGPRMGDIAEEARRLLPSLDAAGSGPS